MAGVDGRYLGGASKPEAHGARRARAGWAAFLDDARGEFSRLSRRDSWTRVDRKHEKAGGAVWGRVKSRRGNGSGLERAAIQDHSGRAHLSYQDADRGGGSVGAPAGTNRRKGIDWTRRFDLRDLRRLLFSWQADRGGGRRGFGDGRSEFSFTLCQQSVSDSPAQRFSRFENHD